MTKFHAFPHRLADLYELVNGDDAVPVEVQTAEDVIHVGLDVLGTKLKQKLVFLVHSYSKRLQVNKPRENVHHFKILSGLAHRLARL